MDGFACVHSHKLAFWSGCSTKCHFGNGYGPKQGKIMQGGICLLPWVPRLTFLQSCCKIYQWDQWQEPIVRWMMLRATWWWRMRFWGVHDRGWQVERLKVNQVCHRQHLIPLMCTWSGQHSQAYQRDHWHTYFWTDTFPLIWQLHLMSINLFLVLLCTCKVLYHKQQLKRPFDGTTKH